MVYFKEGSADLTKTRMRLLTENQTTTFSEEALKNRDIFALYGDMLNVLGQRMQKYPKSTIDISGISSDIGQDATNSNIGVQRAEAVKNYLVNV